MTEIKEDMPEFLLAKLRRSLKSVAKVVGEERVVKVCEKFIDDSKWEISMKEIKNDRKGRIYD